MPKVDDGENVLPPVDEMVTGSLYDVAGKRVVITGGGSGIGAMMAAGFVANGAVVYIVSRKDTTGYADSLTAWGRGSCFSLQADVSKHDDVAHVVAELTKREGRVHCLINNAGTNWSEAVDTYDLKAWDKVYAVNVRSVFAVTQAMLPLLSAASNADPSSPEGPARVINISSIDSITVNALPTFAYSSGKAAVTHLTRVLAANLAARSITVNSILPGAFPSRMMRATLDNAGDIIKRGIPLRRVGGAKDISGMALMLCSRAGAWITGAQLVLDGGATISIKSSL